MPTPERLTSEEIDFSLGFYPSAPALSPEGLQRTIRAGGNVWLRPKGKIEVANGLVETSSTNVGARIFAADIQRATIEGGLVGDRLPYAGFLRYENAVLFFLSEETDAQVFLDEVAVTDLVTSTTPGRLRIGIPDGVGGYDVVDAGFSKPLLSAIGVNPGFGNKDMRGRTGIAIARWRSKTFAYGPPSDIFYTDIPPDSGTTLGISLTAIGAVTGQDGWVVCGTRNGDASGVLRVVRYVYTQPRGTFTATNGSDDLTLGVGTKWTLDLQRGDIVTIDGGTYQFLAIDGDGTATVNTPFTGTTGSGKTMTITTVNNEWYDGELRGVVNRDAQAPPRAAGVLQYGGRVFVFGISDPDSSGSSSESTGNVLAAMLDDNPEHVGLLRIRTDSGSNIVNVLASDGPMFVMTTTSLEVISLTNDERDPYKIRIIAKPGFKGAAAGCLFDDRFYGYNGKPLRTRTEDNIDEEFGEPVKSIMADWTGRVIVQADPDNAAVLYMHDDGSATEVVPWMTQQEQWGPPLNFSARIIDAAVVNDRLYITYLSGGNYKVNEWEGGTGIGGTRFVASQYYDPNALKSGRIKRLITTAKAGNLRVYTVIPDAEVPDVNDTGAAAASFTLSDTANKREPMIGTNIRGDAFAFRVDFSSNDGTFDKLIVRGLPEGEDR